MRRDLGVHASVRHGGREHHAHITRRLGDRARPRRREVRLKVTIGVERICPMRHVTTWRIRSEVETRAALVRWHSRMSGALRERERPQAARKATRMEHSTSVA